MADPVTGAAGAALIEIGIEQLIRTAPSGMSWLSSFFGGKKILVVGPSRAGKTTFVDYFRYGFFGDEKDTDKTDDEEKKHRFRIELGKDKALLLKVKAIIDEPGQWGASKHASLAFDHNPDAIVVLTDLTAALSGEQEACCDWIECFCSKLETKWMSKRRRNNRLKAMIILMNKADKADEEKRKKYKFHLRKVVENKFPETRRSMNGRSIPINPCVLVSNSEHTKYVDDSIRTMAKLLLEN